MPMNPYFKPKAKRRVAKSYYATICCEEGLIWRKWANVRKFQSDFPYRVKLKGFQCRLDAEQWLNDNGIDEEMYNVFEKQPTEQRRLF